MPVTCVVLAAGFSRRRGAPKQLAEWEGEPLVRRAAMTAREVAETIVVVPPLDSELGEQIAKALRGLDVRFAPNEDAAEGMASSIRCGVRAARGDVLITLCDQPLITAAHLRSLIGPGAPIAATAYSGTLGVPAYFAAQFRDELLALQGDAGAKRVIEAHRGVVVAVPFEDAAVDVD